MWSYFNKFHLTLLQSPEIVARIIQRHRERHSWRQDQVSTNCYDDRSQKSRPFLFLLESLSFIHKETVELFGIVLILKIVVKNASSMLEELKEIISLRAEKNIAEIHFNRNSKKLHDNKVSISIKFIQCVSPIWES